MKLKPRTIRKHRKELKHLRDAIDIARIGLGLDDLAREHFFAIQAAFQLGERGSKRGMDADDELRVRKHLSHREYKAALAYVDTAIERMDRYLSTTTGASK